MTGINLGNCLRMRLHHVYDDPYEALLLPITRFKVHVAFRRVKDISWKTHGHRQYKLKSWNPHVPVLPSVFISKYKYPVLNGIHSPVPLVKVFNHGYTTPSWQYRLSGSAGNCAYKIVFTQKQFSWRSVKMCDVHPLFRKF